MRFLFVFTLVLLVSAPSAAFAAPDDVVGRVRLAGEPVSTVLTIYEMYAGQKVAASSEVKAMKGSVSVDVRKKSKEEILKILEEALARQAGVEIVRAQDGGYSARRVAEKK